VFNQDVVSISGNQDSQSLSYHWNFGTANPADTSNEKNVSFMYQQPGNYILSLKVQSQYGCMQQVTKNIIASQGLGPYISGPSEICQNTSANFKGNTQIPGQPTWLWIFDDGTSVQQQNPPSKEYDNAGNFPVKLVVNNNGCIDTVTQLLTVDPKPVATITPHEASLCEGSHITLTASGGTIYKWTPATNLSSVNSAATDASPLVSTKYVVTVTDPHGCTNKDSVSVAVIHRFTMQAETEATVCLGKSATLQVSGADIYQWINNTTGLNNTGIANPIATPAVTTTYTVTGTDAHKCFTDTATIQVTVAPLPVTDAGQSAVILSGTSYQLQSTSSNDVVKWSWSPSQYLSCNNCASPVATPSQPEIYTLTVSNAAGCTASDTVSVKLFCSESRIFIPNAFTPNRDGLNELFSIKGDGIRIVNYFRIYDRWGTLVFAHDNFQIGDKSGSWDGRYKGVLVSQGAYVYFASLSCGEQTFVQKGSITVLY
jgi:gliding motility-associated-like protein